MMAGRLHEYARAVDDAPPLRVLSCESQRLEPRQSDRRGAHRAGLQAYPDSALVEPRRAELRGGGAYRFDLGMSRRVVRAAHGIAGFGDDLVAARHYRANRHLTGGSCLRCKVERAAHRCGKRESHGGGLAKAARHVSYCALATFCAAWLVGGTTFNSGTVTFAVLVPTSTDPVWTSNAGAWLPFA